MGRPGTVLTLLPARKLHSFKQQAKRVTNSLLVSQQSGLAGQMLLQWFLTAACSDGALAGCVLEYAGVW
jgi:hypothetical protein